MTRRFDTAQLPMLALMRLYREALLAPAAAEGTPPEVGRTAQDRVEDAERAAEWPEAFKPLSPFTALWRAWYKLSALGCV